LGSVLGEIADPDGNNNPVKCTRKMDVYGAQRASSGTAQSNHRFVGSLGHTSDPSTGLIYMRARYMDPVTGRFVSEDPAGNGANWFAYCVDNPINTFDKTGLFTYGDVLSDLDELATEMREYLQARVTENWMVGKIQSALIDYSIKLGIWYEEVSEMGPVGKAYDIVGVNNFRIMIHAEGSTGEGPHFQIWFNATESVKVFFSELGTL